MALTGSMLSGPLLSLCMLIAENVSSFLQIACFTPNPVIRETAMKIVKTDNTTILSAICGVEYLEQMARSIISGEPAFLDAIGPFCMILESCLAVMPEQLETRLSFVINLSPPCEHDPIYLLFEALLTMQDNEFLVRTGSRMALFVLLSV
jgi:hypothetical protein